MPGGFRDCDWFENDPSTAIAVEETGFLPSDNLIRKRGYSAFFATDLEILLRGLKVDMLLLCGGHTDVCVHYTFVDGHQSDYYCRVIEDCVAGSDEDAHKASLRALEYLQEGGLSLPGRCSGCNAGQWRPAIRTKFASGGHLMLRLYWRRNGH